VSSQWIESDRMRKPTSKPTVFISSSSETLRFARAVAQELEPLATPIVWSDAFEIASPITAQLSTALSRCDFAICLLNSYAMQERAGPRSDRVRQNEAFELGFVAGALGADRLLIVTIADRLHGGPLLPSDIAGLAHCALPMDAISERTGAQRIASEVTRALRRLEPRPEQLASSYSCFISYSHQDRLFASRLHEDLTEIGVRCWLDAHELRIGDSLIDSIEGGLRACDRMVAVLSSHAIESRWLTTELRLAVELEKQRSSQVILPVRLDNSVLDTRESVWQLIHDRYIADFTEWTDSRKYKRAFASLARDLTLSIAAQEFAP
jgi:hypothetical protein